MKKIIATIIVVPTLYFVGRVYYEANRIATIERPPFEDCDMQKLRKAYNIVFKKTILGQYDFDVTEKSEAEMDAILLQEYNKL